jgi:hypothetical protein
VTRIQAVKFRDHGVVLLMLALMVVQGPRLANMD